ncbi:MAG: uridine kinase [Blastochloris sp.]|nr:uridine kinase [Blastochloris sp.]
MLDQLIEVITSLNTEQPTLVAIDGRSAAGKTTLADELAMRVNMMGRLALRSSIDDFHPPGHKYRSRERRYTPQTYYAEGYDYAAFRQLLLEPLHPGGSRCCRLALWDSFNDVPFPEQWTEALGGAIVIVDGIFLLRPDLRPSWDYSIWVQIDWDAMIERATQRDVAWAGSAEVVADHYRTFWIPTHEMYEAEVNPALVAHAIVDNQRPEAPALIKTNAASAYTR